MCPFERECAAFLCFADPSAWGKICNTKSGNDDINTCLSDNRDLYAIVIDIILDQKGAMIHVAVTNIWMDCNQAGVASVPPRIGNCAVFPALGSYSQSGLSHVQVKEASLLGDYVGQTLLSVAGRMSTPHSYFDATAFLT